MEWNFHVSLVGAVVAVVVGVVDLGDHDGGADVDVVVVVVVVASHDILEAVVLLVNWPRLHFQLLHLL